MKNSLTLYSAFLASLILSGCATLFSKSDYPVTILSEPTRMDVVITRSDGQIVHEDTTPATVTLSASKGFFQGESYTIELVRDGAVVGRTKLNSRIDAWFFVNLVHITPERAVFGLLIDPLTGSMWALKKEVRVTEETQAGTRNLESTLQIATLSSVSKEDRKNLVKIEPDS